MAKNRFTFADAKLRIAELEKALLAEQKRVKKLLDKELTDGKFGKLEVALAAGSFVIGLIVGLAL